MGKEISADYYEILQVNPKADQEMIERAYRLLAKRYHPDNQDTGDAGKFGTLMEAYLVLSDPEKRAAYDCNHEGVKTREDNFFSNIHPSRNSHDETRLYQAILLILYVARRADVMNGETEIAPGFTPQEKRKIAERSRSARERASIHFLWTLPRSASLMTT